METAPPPDPAPPARWRTVIVVAAVFGVMGAGVWFAWKYRLIPIPGIENALERHNREVREQAEAQWGSYAAARERSETERKALLAEWNQAPAAKKPAVLHKAAAVLSDVVGRRLVPFWLGTDWDFNGTSDVPQRGAVACGHFVAVLLKHAGFAVDRMKLGQQASQNIIFTFTGGPHIHKGHEMPLADFVKSITALGPGLHIVGLDTHAGLLWHDGTKLWFIHSAGPGMGGVLMERASESGVLGRSRYRITGNLTADDRAVEAWLTGKSLSVYQPPPKAVPIGS